MKPRRYPLLTAAALAVVTVLTWAAPASAAVDPIPLDDGNKGLVSATGSTGDTYTFTTTSRYWSGVLVKSEAMTAGGSDYDMTVADDASKAVLATSTYGSGVMDFVVVDSNLRAPGTYQLTTKLYSGSGWTDIWFRQKNEILPGLSSAPAPVYTVTDQWLMVKDVYLAAGECLGVKAWRFADSAGQMMVMASDPAHPVQGRSAGQATVGWSQSDGNSTVKTLRYTAPRAGWYGFVISNLPTDIPNTNTTVQYQRTTC